MIHRDTGSGFRLERAAQLKKSRNPREGRQLQYLRVLDAFEPIDCMDEFFALSASFYLLLPRCRKLAY